MKNLQILVINIKTTKRKVATTLFFTISVENSVVVYWNTLYMQSKDSYKMDKSYSFLYKLHLLQLVANR